jgi:hypothetical protein
LPPQTLHRLRLVLVEPGELGLALVLKDAFIISTAFASIAGRSAPSHRRASRDHDRDGPGEPDHHLPVHARLLVSA